MGMIRARGRVIVAFGTWAFLAISFFAAAESAPGGPPGERILHFPSDASLGPILVCDWETTRSYTSYQPLVSARGDVRVPAGKAAFLSVVQVGPTPPSLAPLTALKPDDIQYIAFQSVTTDADLVCLKGLTGLQQIHINFALFGDEAMANLSGITSLREIRLRGSRITGAGFSHLKKLPALRRLEFAGENLSDAGLAEIAQLATVEELRLGIAQVSETGLAKLRDLPSLRTLHLTNVRIADATLGQLADFPKLEDLSLQGTRFSGERLASLSRLRSLRVLNLRTTLVGDPDLAHLAGLTNLQSLNLAQTPVTDAGLAHLKKLSSLKTLDLSGTRVTATHSELQKILPSVENIMTGAPDSAGGFPPGYPYRGSRPGVSFAGPMPPFPGGAPTGMAPPMLLTSLRPRAATTAPLSFETARKKLEDRSFFSGTIKFEEGTFQPGQFGPGRGVHAILSSQFTGPQGPVAGEDHVWLMDPRYNPLRNRAQCDASSWTAYLGRTDDYQVFFRSEFSATRGMSGSPMAIGPLQNALGLDRNSHMDLICRALEGTDLDLKRAAVDDLYLFEAHSGPSAEQYGLVTTARAYPLFEKMMETADVSLRRHVSTLYREEDLIAALSRIRAYGSGPGGPALRGVIVEAVKNRPDLTDALFRYCINEGYLRQESGYGSGYRLAALLRIMPPASSDTLRLALKARRRADSSQPDEFLSIVVNQAVKTRCRGVSYEMARCLWHRDIRLRNDALEYFRQVRDETTASDLFKAIEEAGAATGYERPESILQQLLLSSGGSGFAQTGGVTQLIESGYPWRTNLDAICTLPVTESFRKTLREVIRRQEPTSQRYEVDKQYILTVLALNFLIRSPDPEVLPDLLPLLAMGGGPPVGMAGTMESTDTLFIAIVFNPSHALCHYAARAVIALGPKAASGVAEYLKRELDRRFSPRRFAPDGSSWEGPYSSQYNGDIAYCMAILGFLGDERVAAEPLNLSQRLPSEIRRAWAIGNWWFRQGGREFHPPRPPLRPRAESSAAPSAVPGPFGRYRPARARAELKTLDLARREIAEEELAYIGQMTWLRELHLSSTGIADDAVAKIRPPASLEVLDLSRNQITDASMVHLAPLKGLQILDLGSTAISDASIAQLKKLTSLRLLYLGDTQISKAGVAELRKALPQCEIWK
jgi:Leucine-rich repeat (LRR) protein